MPQKKRVLIGVPMHRGELSAATTHSIVQGSSQFHEVNFQLLGLSLLAKNFNMLFISAYKKGYDYFILHHSDIGVVGNVSGWEGSWVDLLVHRMEELKPAALSAVVPIKSGAGFTSTALEMVKGDPFSLRRLTIAELERCPVDFINKADLCEIFGTNEDETGALLVNTGLMIMPLRNVAWAKLQWPGFDIKDTIEWNTKGDPESFTIPEDWDFSRWVHYEAPSEFQVLATKELIVGHVGQHVFQNTGGWGDHASDINRQQVSIENYRKT
jgi:hypothetical protein